MHVEATILIQFISLCCTPETPKLDIREARADKTSFPERFKTAIIDVCKMATPPPPNKKQPKKNQHNLTEIIYHTNQP